MAKKAAAFRWTSFSCLRTRFSLLSRPNSSRSSVVEPYRSPASISVCSTHLLKDSADTPSSRAASEIGLPEEWTSQTASRRNSGGYGGLVLGTSSPLRGRSSPSLYLSTDAKQYQKRFALTLGASTVEAWFQEQPSLG